MYEQSSSSGSSLIQAVEMRMDQLLEEQGMVCTQLDATRQAQVRQVSANRAQAWGCARASWDLAATEVGPEAEADTRADAEVDAMAESMVEADIRAEVGPVADIGAVAEAEAGVIVVVEMLGIAIRLSMALKVVVTMVIISATATVVTIEVNTVITAEASTVAAVEVSTAAIIAMPSKALASWLAMCAAFACFVVEQVAGVFCSARCHPGIALWMEPSTCQAFYPGAVATSWAISTPVKAVVRGQAEANRVCHTRT